MLHEPTGGGDRSSIRNLEMREPMKKKTVITTKTREVWVIRQASRAGEEPASQDREIEPPSESPPLNLDHDAKKDNDSSAESTAKDEQD